jgi:hypothetical protein
MNSRIQKTQNKSNMDAAGGLDRVNLPEESLGIRPQPESIAPALPSCDGGRGGKLSAFLAADERNNTVHERDRCRFGECCVGQDVQVFDRWYDMNLA